MQRHTAILIALVAVMLALFIADLLIGSVDISISEVWAALTGGECNPISRDIILKIRLLKSVMALLAGAALATSGLQMQTIFRNPLAGPYVLGVSSGAGLGVALFILGTPILGVAHNTFIQSIGVAGAAWAGSAMMLLMIIAISRRVKDIMVILILGMMVGSAIGSVITILQYLSDESALKSFVVWTMGSLSSVTASQIYIIAPIVAIGLLLSISTIKPLNILLLGENYARTMGINITHSRRVIFISTILLAGTITAFCGPIGFVGLAVPHLARMLFASTNHRILIPATMVMGGIMLLACNLISKVMTLPINSITALMGIPIVIIVIIRNHKIVR